jgi:hypothetical protein
VEDLAPKWWHARWRLTGRKIPRFAIASTKIVGLLCLIAVVIGGVLYLVQPWLFSQHLGKNDPQLRTTPASLPSTAQAALSNSSIGRGGIKFLLPNEATVSTTKFQQTTLVRFPNGMLEFVGPLRDDDSIVFRSVHSNNDAEKLLGQELLHSQLKLLQAAMLATPEQVKWWRFRSRQNKKVEILLLLKFVAFTQYYPMHSLTVRPVYAIASGEFRGFQFGDPNKSPYDTHVDLFDGANHHLALNISGFQGHGQVITQEELNAMVASIRLAADL